MTRQGAFALPDQRPAGLRTRWLDLTWWRIDGAHPEGWGWTGFAAPRHRFDPLSGRFRVRYAATTQRAAARERFPERRIVPADAGLWLVRLTGRVRMLDLCSERTQDLLGVDDRINTGRMPHVRGWRAAGAARLPDAGPLLVSLVEGDGFRVPRAARPPLLSGAG